MMEELSDTLVSDTLECFEDFPFQDLDEGYVNDLWRSSFASLEELPPCATNSFSEGLFEPITKAIDIAERWIERSVECQESTSYEENNDLQLWTVLMDNDVEIKYLLSFLFAVCSKSIKPSAVKYEKEMGLKCAKLYFTLLRIPGNTAYSVFHPSLFRLAIDCFKFPKEKVAGKKRQPTSAYRNDVVPQRKRPRRDDNSEFVDPEDVAAPSEIGLEEETEFSQRECEGILENFSDVLKSVILLLRTFSLNNNIELVEHMAEKLSDCVCFAVRQTDTNFERSIDEIFKMQRRHGIGFVFTALAYNALLTLCDPMHGNEEDNYTFILKVLKCHILCSKAKSQPNQTISQKYIAVKDSVVAFVCYNLDKHPNYAIKSTKILVQQLCVQCIDKTDYRTKVAAAILSILKHFPLTVYAEMEEWFVRLATHKVQEKVMALEVISLLLSEPQQNVCDENFPRRLAIYTTYVPLVSTVIERCMDKAPTVRTKAVNVLTNSLKKILHVLKHDHNEAIDADAAVSHNDNDGDNNDEEDPEYREKSVKRTRTVLSKWTVDQLAKILHLRTQDIKVHARKSALQALEQLLHIDENYLTEDNLELLRGGALDPNITVRKAALSSLTVLLQKYPDSRLVQQFWMRTLLPSVLDPEKTVQSKGLEELEAFFLVNNHGSLAMRQCAWTMLNEIASGENRDLARYLRKAFSCWYQDGKLKPNLSVTLDKELGTEHDCAAWMLLSIISSHTEIKNFASVISWWEKSADSEVKSSTMLRMLEVLGYSCRYMKGEKLKYLQGCFENQIRNFDCDCVLISTMLETLLKIYKAQHPKSETSVQEELNRFASEVLPASEKFLSELILEKFPTEENQSEDLICQHLQTVGELVMLAPACTPTKMGLLLQSIIATSVPEDDDACSVGSGHGKPLSQSWSPSPKVRAIAFASLGKLCLQNETFAKKCIPVFVRELTTSKSHEVRLNIVTVLSDLCIRYTLTVDLYIPSISTRLKDENAKIRRQTLSLISRLLQEDYIKLKDSLLFRLLSVLSDKDPELCAMAEYLLGHLLIKKHPTIFIQHIVECVFYFNCCKANQAIKFNQNDDDVKLFALKGKRNCNKRMTIYKFMCKTTGLTRKLQMTFKVAQDILQPIASNLMPLNESTSSVIKDCFMILCLDELKLPQHLGNNASEDTEDGGGAENTDTEVCKYFEKISIIYGVVPVVIALKKLLEESKSPLLCDLLHFLAETVRDYKNEVKEFFASDPQLGIEIEYEIKKFEKEQEKKQAAIRNQETESEEEERLPGIVAFSDHPHNNSMRDVILSAKKKAKDIALKRQSVLNSEKNTEPPSSSMLPVVVVTKLPSAVTEQNSVELSKLSNTVRKNLNIVQNPTSSNSEISNDVLCNEDVSSALTKQDDASDEQTATKTTKINKDPPKKKSVTVKKKITAQNSDARNECTSHTLAKGIDVCDIANSDSNDSRSSD